MLQMMVNRRKNGKCPFCGEEIDESKFRNPISKKEYEMSGLCQKCQDEVYGYD